MSKWVNDFNSNMDSLGDRLRDKEIRVPIDLDVYKRQVDGGPV